MSSNLSLLILAAGVGSRYQSAKQIDVVGSSGQILLQYSIYDAINAGFNKIILVVNNDVEQLLKKQLVYLEDVVELFYINQNNYNLSNNINRKKPWGTAHAVLVAQQYINEPFMVLNADDFYGKTAFELASNFLVSNSISATHMGMIAYKLKNTLSKHGSVSRGICQVDANNYLLSIKEHTSIVANEQTISSSNNKEIIFNSESLVSMNCWLFHPSIFKELVKGFADFFSLHSSSETVEYFLPDLVMKTIENNKINFSLIKSTDKWMGLTYLKDKIDFIETLTKCQLNKSYPESFHD